MDAIFFRVKSLKSLKSFTSNLDHRPYYTCKRDFSKKLFKCDMFGGCIKKAVLGLKDAVIIHSKNNNFTKLNFVRHNFNSWATPRPTNFYLHWQFGLGGVGDTIS